MMKKSDMANFGGIYQMLTVKKKLLLIRHGKTEWNSEARFQGSTDIPLNDQGYQQALKTAERIKSWRGVPVFSSPLKRAMQTAEVLSAGEPVTPLDGLTEINFGDWEGERVADIGKKDAHALAEWHRDGFFAIPGNAETWEQIYERVSRSVDACLEREEERMIIVAHGGILRVIMIKLMNFDPHTAWRLAVYNCSISGVDICRGVNNLVFLNDTLHLSAGEVCNVPFYY
ncbi:MAG: histidine phosphatase family protein [Synergistaceae bacterium]|nr:histidine phosphatase family protein [Synergistaceae bacterium]